MGGSCDTNCELADICCQIIAISARETHRSREAQRRADDETLRRLIAASMRRLRSEAEAALQRLQAGDNPGGMQVRVFMGYAFSPMARILRQPDRVEHTQEHTIWQVFYARGASSILLMSGGGLYDDWSVRRSTVDNSPLLANLSPIMPDKQDGIFTNPRRPRIQRHVDQIVRGLQQLGM